jgi:hypothetical protein
MTVWLLPGDRILAQRYWDAIFQLGYDPFTKQVSNRLACQRINKLYDLQVRVSDHLEVDPELESRIQDLHSRLTSLDAANLYDILPYSDSARLWRGVGIRGSSESPNYYLKMYDPEINDWLTSSGGYIFRFKPPNVHLGDIDLRTFIKPDQKNIYRLAAEAQMYLDDIPAQTVTHMLDGMLKTLWQHAGRDIKPPPGVERKTLPNRQSTNVLNGLTRDFPGLVRIILEYFTVDNIISAKPDRGDDSVLLGLRAQFNLKAFVKKFPEIESLLMELKDSVFFRIRLHDEQGRLMGIMELDSVDKEFTILLRIRNGRLLSLTGGIGDRNTNSFSLTAPGYQRFYLAYDIHLNIVGLRLNIESLPIAVDYMNRDRELEITACLWQPPEVIKAGGWAFGFIPLWLVNALIPSNVEEITTNFFRALALGNDGEGSHIDLASHGVRERKNHIHLQAGTDVLSNGTIKLAFNMQRKMLARQEALLKEIQAFNKQFIAAFYQDYQRVKSIRGCQ